MAITRPWHRWLKPGLALLGALCWLSAHLRLAYGEDLSPDQAKVSMVYNFPKFVEWPPSPSPELVLCIFSADRFGPSFNALHGKALKDKTVMVRRITAVSDSRVCQLLFIPATETSQLPALLQALQDSPVLTVSDSEGVAARGVMIEIIMVEESRLGFKINLQVARQRQLQLSSQLLKLARAVY